MFLPAVGSYLGITASEPVGKGCVPPIHSASYHIFEDSILLSFTFATTYVMFSYFAGSPLQISQEQLITIHLISRQTSVRLFWDEWGLKYRRYILPF